MRQNFRVGKLSRLYTIHFAVHQALAIMYCTQQVIRGENFRDRLKNREKRESFPTWKFCRILHVVYYVFSIYYLCHKQQMDKVTEVDS